jgi:hypothetical protein
MQHTYSFCGSPLHLVLEDKIAEGYNRFTDAFLAGQKKFKEENGTNWTPDQPLWLEFQPEDKEAYDKVGRIINLLAEINGGAIEITEEQCTSDHLIRV